MGEWQPIETYWRVPDKTKPILVYFPNWGVEKVKSEFTGADTFVFGNRQVLARKPDWLDCKSGPSIPPTHWMPLPPPPEQQS
jgi:uncharacterized membrane protein